MENNNYSRLKYNAKCFKCLGCNKLESPKFVGVYSCENFKQDNKTVWCANEVIQHFMKTGKVK